jgi:hypothetical protein
MVPMMRWGAEKTYDYFSTKHTRNSYDNAGAGIKATHYGVADNAYWNGSVMTYGDGSGTNLRAYFFRRGGTRLDMQFVKNSQSSLPKRIRSHE